MQVVFGENTFDAVNQPRENGNMLILAFDPGESTFDEVKTITHSQTNTRTIEFIDGEHTIEYRDFVVFRELVFNDKDDEITATVTLYKEDLTDRVTALADYIEDTNTAIDEIMTVVIPELLFGGLEE